MTYCGLVVDENCNEQDGWAAIYNMQVESEARRTNSKVWSMADIWLGAVFFGTKFIAEGQNDKP